MFCSCYVQQFVDTLTPNPKPFLLEAGKIDVIDVLLVHILEDHYVICSRALRGFVPGCVLLVGNRLVPTVCLQYEGFGRRRVAYSFTENCCGLFRTDFCVVGNRCEYCAVLNATHRVRVSSKTWLVSRTQRDEITRHRITRKWQPC